MCSMATNSNPGSLENIPVVTCILYDGDRVLYVYLMTLVVVRRGARYDQIHDVRFYFTITI